MSLNSFLTQLDQSDATVGFGTLRLREIDGNHGELVELAREHGLEARIDRGVEPPEVVIG